MPSRATCPTGPSSRTLAIPFDGPTVVVTHHAPHPDSVARRFENDPLTPAFVSDLSEVIDRWQPALWFHGHTHDNFDYRVGATRIVCNPKGYGPMPPGRRIENVAFDVGRVVEVCEACDARGHCMLPCRRHASPLQDA
jgi:hypothetical protein